MRKPISKLIFKIIAILLSFYLLFCVFFFLFQEKLIFIPDKLDKDYTFSFKQNFEDISIPTQDGILLNGLLFKSEKSKGLIFYLHGNAGALNSWGQIASVYTYLDYDIFILDYRGFGKSGGHLRNQTQLFEDVQTAYNKMKEQYDENKIIVLGYSIGTCLAAKISADNNPRLLILQAPYYSLTNVIHNICPIIPNFLVRYKLETYKYMKDCKAPVVIFHGNEDKIINYDNSLKLETLFKNKDILITLEGENHNEITNNHKYLSEISKILAQ